MNQNAIPNPDRRPVSLIVQTSLLVLSLLFVATTFFMLARDARHEQAWTRLANEVQVSSQQLSKSGAEAAAGNLEAFEELAAAHERMKDAMQALADGTDTLGVPGLPNDLQEPFSQLSMTWSRVSGNSNRIRDRESLILAMTDANREFVDFMPELEQDAERAVQALTDDGAPLAQLAAASQLPALAERMLRRVSEIFQGGSQAVTSARSLNEDIERFEQTLSALLTGSQKLGIPQVAGGTARNRLNKVHETFQGVRPQLQIVLDSSSALYEIRGAADEILADSRLVFNKAGELAGAAVDLPHSRVWPSIATGVAGLLFMCVVVALLVRAVVIAERQRAIVATSRDRMNQRAIKRLLDELGSLAKGDLTVQATVTEEITRDIAKAVNYAVQRLREIVTGINNTAQAVADNAQATRSSAFELAQAAARQAGQIDGATEDIRQMSDSFDSMAKRSHDSSEVAHKSVQIAHHGAEKVRETIAGMDLIRDQIQGTSKRIKRLGESTQEIGDIVALINGIAEQTNVLALNAAIQAASAGGAGKGFAMVADEVQELAESATQATRRIESLVQTIQADTSEAVHSMESTTTEVVRGAHLAEDAGAALQKIEAVSNDLSTMIEAISNEAQAHSESATRISELMLGVREVSLENSGGSKQTAETIDELAKLVMKLSESVSDFRLPGGKSGD